MRARPGGGRGREVRQGVNEDSPLEGTTLVESIARKPGVTDAEFSDLCVSAVANRFGDDDCGVVLRLDVRGLWLRKG